MTHPSSGKGAGDENFPVGSFLLSRRIRPHVAAYYRFARTIDDVADSSQLSPKDKIARLDRFAQIVRDEVAAESGYESATAIQASLKVTGVSPKHCTDLIVAFKQDAVKLRYDSWNDLIGYCMHSAAPVGRYLIDLHGESNAAWPASDALCNALQVLNHLQDCGQDYTTLNRVYLPQGWLHAAGGAVEELSAPHLSPALRRVVDQCLDATDTLIKQARALPRLIRNRRFAMEAGVIVQIARCLSVKLRRNDPLAKRVVLNKAQYLACGLTGCLKALVPASTK